MNYKHGLVGTTTYNVWASMKRRCNDPNNIDYKNYGGRGIYYPEKWNNFLGFLEDMGECPIGYSIDRIDNEKGYSKENCRWIPSNQQSYNRRISLRYTYQGKTQTLGQWCKEYNLKYHTVYARITVGCKSFESAMGFK